MKLTTIITVVIIAVVVITFCIVTIGSLNLHYWKNWNSYLEGGIFKGNLHRRIVVSCICGDLHANATYLVLIK